MGKFGCFIATLAIGAAAYAGFTYMSHKNVQEYTVTIEETGKAPLLVFPSQHRNYVYAKTEDGKEIVFENQNSFLRSKKNAEDMQKMFKENEGAQYKIKTDGFCVPRAGLYPNIMRYEQISSGSSSNLGSLKGTVGGALKGIGNVLEGVGDAIKGDSVDVKVE